MSVETMRVLICDDSAFVRKKTAQMLKNIGVAEVYEAGDGEQAVQVYKDKLPDLTLMDIVMPVETGVDALKEILEANPKAKVVMASSVGTQEKLKNAINLGAFDFLQKPISEEQLRTVIEKIAE